MRTCAIVVFVVTLVASVHCLSDENKERFQAAHKACQDDPKTHIDEDILKEFNSGAQKDKAVIGPYILCFCSKFGTVNLEGKVSKPILKEGLSAYITDEAKLNSAVEKCAVETGDAQETAIAVTRCFREEVGILKR